MSEFPIVDLVIRRNFENKFSKKKLDNLLKLAQDDYRNKQILGELEEND